MLITGCARSGTAYISKFLLLNGYQVGHEYDAQFGIVSWPMAADANETPWGPAYNEYRFNTIIHQVRHPLKTIASASNEPMISWAYIKKFVPEINLSDPKIVKGAKYWYYWNLLAEKKAEWTYRIEDLGNVLDEMSSRVKVPLYSSIIKDIPKNTNTRGYKNVYTWTDLKSSIDETLYQNIVNMAIRYGYKVVDSEN